MDTNLTLTTARLTLRPLAAGDAPFVLALQSEKGWRRFIGDRGVHDQESARAYIANGPMASYREHGHGLFCVEERDSTAPVGICGLVRRPGLPAPDLGFAFLEAYSGRGYATESSVAVLEHAQQAWSQFFTRCFGNHASVRVLEKLGFSEQEPRAIEAGADPVRVFLFVAGDDAP